MKKFLLASALILSATAASAQGFYAGVQYAGVQLEEDTTTLNADLNGLGVVAGYHFNEHFALEGRYLGGVGSDTVLGFKTELDDYVGINVVGSDQNSAGNHRQAYQCCYENSSFFHFMVKPQTIYFCRSHSSIL